MRNFQTFSRELPRCSVPPQVTVLRSRIFSLNVAAYQALGCADAVELLYDAVNHIVGLRPVGPRAATAYLVRHPSRGSGGPFMITAIAYMKYYEIDTSRSRRWAAFVEDGVLCVCLEHPSVEVTSNRARATPDVVALRPALELTPELAPRVSGYAQ